MASVIPISVSDAAQRRQAIDPNRSFIVEAPAGSGKTSLLVQRFLHLLSVAERPESVVAMTFTRKAAAEMRERVLGAIEAAEQGTPVENDHEILTRDLAHRALRQSQTCDWGLLANRGRLQIQTIDSFCHMLVRQMPLTSGLGGMATVVDDPDALYRVAARRTLTELTEAGEHGRGLFRRLALHFDNNMNRLENQICRMLGKRDQWRLRPGDLEDALVNDFCILQQHAHETLVRVFHEQGEVDFTEVTSAAIRALGPPEQPTDLLYWLDYKITHLLVDEFQDTSQRQYKLLEALSGQWSDRDGHTLFVVGDPMQSIYRFREAEVSLFLQCWHRQELGSVRLEALRLTSNFRSTPEIVKWTQETFAPIMCEDDPLCGAVKLRPASAVRASSARKPKLVPLIDDKGSEEAQAIIDIIRSAPARSDVAVLVRSRAQVASLLPALRSAGIPYEAIDIDGLKEEPHILDLVSLTRAILHVADRISWLACLRAPWCGLTVVDLAALAEGEASRTILDLLSDENKIAALSPDGRVRAVKLQEVLLAAVEHVGRLPLRELVETAWMALGGPAVLTQRNQHEDVDTFFALLEQCEQGGVIRDFGLLNERLQSLWAKPAKDADAVQVLTIHNAKGLEFGTVILPKLGAKTAFSERDVLVWTEHLDDDGTLKLLVAAKPQSGVECPNYEAVCEQLDKKESYELQRLFYVATTRAKDELYLLGNVNRKEKGGLRSVDKRTFLGLIWESVREEFESELRRKAVPAAASGIPAAAAKQTFLRRLPSSWRMPVLEHSVSRNVVYERVTASSSKLTYRWVSDTGRHVGTIVHGLLKRISTDGMNSWDEDRLMQAETIVRGELSRLGVRSSDQNAALAQVTRAIRNTLASTRGRWILESRPEAHSEWGLEGLIGSQLVSGTVDRMFCDSNGDVWIVDFKTSEHEGADLQAFLRREEARYRPQLESYAALVSRMRGGAVHLGLYFPLLDGWREWVFAAEQNTASAVPYTGE